MKNVRFIQIEAHGSNPVNRRYVGIVQYETGFWFWRKLRTARVARQLACEWHDISTGAFFVGGVLNCAERAFCATNHIASLSQMPDGGVL